MVSAQIMGWKLGSGIGDGLRYRTWREFFRAKSQHFGVDDSDACGFRDPLEGVVVATLDTLGLRVKTLRSDLLGGVVMELRFP